MASTIEEGAKQINENGPSDRRCELLPNDPACIKKAERKAKAEAQAQAEPVAEPVAEPETCRRT